MKYLHVIASVDPRLGGPIEGVVQLNRWMGAAGHTVHVASCDDPAAAHVRSSPLDLIALGPSRGNYSYSPKLIPWLRAHASEYEAVVVNGLWQYHSLATYRALRKTNTPYVVFTHGMLDPWFKHAYPLKHIKKWLYWPWAEFRVLKNAKSVLFTSEEERRMARKSFWLYKCTERVVSYGTASPPSGDIEAQKMAFLERFPLLTGKRLVLFLGRIHPKKGCDLLIKAFARIAGSDSKLHLVMAGPDNSGWGIELAELAKSLGIAERITWTGMLENDFKWGAFRTAEVFILPSHQENFGIGVAEALACGIPVLISDKVNIWREVTDDGAGLVDHDDEQGTIRMLKNWVSLSQDERVSMKKKALHCFAKRFEIGKVAASLLELLQESISSPKGSVPMILDPVG